ncbi:acetyltransferase [Haloarcula hispanica N601]|uniref:GNAT family N-acetyltransferase n=3 Tax=Haloarcula hispanica TaxID=51589 RepID=A0A482TCF1_HALHI|nr:MULTISPECIES: GNAT family N-acetyltransferase [Haloarcula]AEM58564.1 acetyltransferase [Haloarcula hispanica ATCC 33960]AHB67287.1 acetyltransferase [Haloarcula hispanica N601]AJF25550.1 acetyltransferase [Haloarcula sp. CBA1115]KAA9405807.1 GNAT family N-acetyltransferase [Haloarcula sp. CBA1131]KAA9408301.1 GNAT family N-acetyltransferase [Haloarcula hispanica]
MHVRTATADEVPAVMNVLDGAVLSIAVETVRAGAEDDGTLVAVSDDDPAAERVLGALVLDDTHIEAVAVRRRRRGQGIGTALVEAALDRRDCVTAEFDADVRPFYEALGFTIEPLGEPDRFRGERA